MNLYIDSYILKKLKKYKLDINEFFLLHAVYIDNNELVEDFIFQGDVKNALVKQSLERQNLIKMNTLETDSLLKVTDKGIEVMRDLLEIT